jgi:hypothetical protein
MSRFSMNVARNMRQETGVENLLDKFWPQQLSNQTRTGIRKVLNEL